MKEVLVRSETRSVRDVVRKITDRRIDLGVFSRPSSWDNSKQSNFLELVMMRIPIRDMFVYENSVGVIKLIDGFNRLSTLKIFLEGEVRRYLWGSMLRFSERVPRMQNRLEDAQITFHIIDYQTPIDVLADVIKRIGKFRA